MDPNNQTGWLIYAGGIALAITAIWKLVDMVKHRGQREQRIEDTLESLKKSDGNHDEDLRELRQEISEFKKEMSEEMKEINRKVDLILQSHSTNHASIDKRLTLIEKNSCKEK